MIGIDYKSDEGVGANDKEMFKFSELHISYADAGNSLKPRNLADPLS